MAEVMTPTENSPMVVHLRPVIELTYVYRPQLTVESLEAPPTVSGEPVLPGFILNLSRIW